MLTDQNPIDLPGMEGVVVYSDTSASGRYYYMPTRPRVAVRDGVYQYSLIEYQAPLLNNRAGLLSMVVDLHLKDTERKALEAALKKRSSGSSISLNPIPWTAGTFSVALETGKPVTGVPSLIGTNAALVHLEMDLDAYNQFNSVLSAGLTPPISIVYKLSFDVFRPAYQCTVKLKEANFLNWVRKECHANLVILDFESTETYTTLRKEKVLEITSVNFDPDSNTDFQMSILKSLQYILQPVPSFGKMPASNESGWSLGFSCSEMEQVQEISKRVDFNMSMAKAVPQAAYVQGVVEGLDLAFAAIPALQVPSSGGSGFSNDVLVTCYADYVEDGISAVVLNVRTVGGPVQFTHSLDAADAAAWKMRLDYIPGNGSAYEYQYTVHFSTGKPVTSLSSDWQPIGRGQAFVNLIARTLFSHRMIDITTAKEFPWNAVKRVSVSVTPPENHDARGMLEQLDAEDPSASSGMFLVPACGTDTIDYTLAVLPNDNFGQLQNMGPYLANTSIFIDPFEAREVHFMASGVDWSTVSNITVVATLETADKPILGKATTTMILTKANQIAKLTYYYTDSSQLLIHYRYRIRHGDTRTEGGGTSPDVFIDIPSIATTNTS